MEAAIEHIPYSDFISEATFPIRSLADCTRIAEDIFGGERKLEKKTIICALECCPLNSPLRGGVSLNLSSFLRSAHGLGFLRLGKRCSLLQAPLQIYDNYQVGHA
jgi:hypothetical protein